MAKKVSAYIKLQVPAGQANPSPPVGPALGQHGVNIMEFCKGFNAQTQGIEQGAPVPVVITVYGDRSFTFDMKTPPASYLLKKAAGEEGKLYSVAEAFGLLKELSAVKFNETVDVAINLGIDPRKSDQIVRGATTLPNGSGKDVRVCVFAQGDAADAAKAAGAELVGMDELAEEIKGGMMDFDVVIAAPDAMRVVGLLGKVLGPRGLMPNPKSGTVTPDVATAVKNAKAGQVRFRADKNGIVHGGIGVITFEAAALQQNLEALMADLAKAKPASAKGVYIKKITVSSTMGPGLLIDQGSLSA